jgi:glycerol-3-phosphate O-acyltransferase
MNEPITIPIWFFVILLGVFALTLVERVLFPLIRRFMQRRINSVIDDISRRLSLEIRPFQLTKRQVLIDRLVNDPAVITAIQHEAEQRRESREKVQKEALAYAKEIVPAFNAYLYFRIGYWVAKKIARLLYQVHIGLIDSARLEKIDPNSTVVFVMNHRSNMDYIIVSFLVAERTALSYAVGEWARIWPLQTLIRAMGAFFVRRHSNNVLYRLVLERYIRMATKEGVCQAVFPEGGLSRNGRMQPPKFGIIDYMVRNYQPDMDRDIVFVPVGINYDRTIEDRSLLRSLDPDAEKTSHWYVIKTTFRFIFKSIKLMVLSRWRKFGYACVNFGSYISLRDYCKEMGVDFSCMNRAERFKAVESLSNKLMGGITAVIPVLPIPLVAAVFQENPVSSLTAFQVEERVNGLITDIQTRGAPVFISTRSRVQNILTALHMLKIRRLLHESNGEYKADPDMRDVLNYYANSITHWRTVPKYSAKNQHDPPVL